MPNLDFAETLLINSFTQYQFAITMLFILSPLMDTTIGEESCATARKF